MRIAVLGTMGYDIYFVNFQSALEIVQELNKIEGIEAKYILSPDAVIHRDKSELCYWIKEGWVKEYDVILDYCSYADVRWAKGILPFPYYEEIFEANNLFLRHEFLFNIDYSKYKLKGIFFETEQSANNMRKRLGDTPYITFSPLGVPKELSLVEKDRDDYKILYTGRLVLDRVDFLIKVMELLPQQFTLDLYILPDAATTESLDKIKDNKRIQIKEAVPTYDLYQVMYNAKIGINLGWINYDNGNLFNSAKNLNYLRAGLSVVSDGCFANNYILEECGETVLIGDDFNNPERFAEEIVKAQQRNNREKSIEKVVSEYNWEKITSEMLDDIKKVIEGGKK